MLFHSTLYEGALERARIDLGVPAFAVSVDTVAVKLATKTVRNRLLHEWKKGQSKPEYGNIKFVSEPPCADGASNELPTMQLCKIVGEGADSVLSAPTDIRQKWLGDPAHAPEWRSLLRKFDAKHGAVPAPRQGVVAASGSQAAPVAAGASLQSDWDNIFSGDPKQIQDLEQKFSKIGATFAIDNGDGLVCYVVEGPQFYLAAPTNAGSFTSSQLLLGHGGGSWLLDAKAAKAIEDG